MNAKQIEMKVEELFESVYSSDEHSDEILSLQNNLSITRENLLASWLYWDTGIRNYGNEVYTSEAVRLAMHLHNYLNDSWHQKRQAIVLRYLRSINAKSIYDIGFGVPQKYVKEFMIDRETNIFLGDFEPSSLDFAKLVLEFWDRNWEETVHLRSFDMNKDSLPKDYDAYLFQDSIEHAMSPGKTLRMYTASASRGAHFIFSLPIEIESPIPEHNILWKNEDDVFDWLNKSGLNVINSETIHMNPDVDLFSLSLHPDFREVVILARKP